jgi:hypothetical protein
MRGMRPLQDVPHKIFYSRNVVFNESIMFILDLSTNYTNQNPETHNVQVEKVDDNVDAARLSAGNSSPVRKSSRAVQPP